MRVVFCDMGAHCQFNQDGKCMKEMIKIKNGQCYLLFNTCNDKKVEEVIEEGEWREWTSSTESDALDANSTST